VVGYKGRGFPPPAWNGEGAGWMHLSRIATSNGGTIEGILVVDMGPHGATGGGRFVAKVDNAD
jgi:hypothetical protein